MKTNHLIMATAAALATASPAWAQASATVDFDGSVEGACELSVTRPGTLGLDGDGKVLSSRSQVAPEGVSGTVSIKADANFDLSIEAPTVTSSSPDGDLQAVAAGQVGQTDIEAGSPVSAPEGTSEMTVDVEIERAGDGDLSAGDYRASVIVNCEPANGPLLPQ